MSTPTHAVTNQVPSREGYDAYTEDPCLVEAVDREGAAWAHEELSRLGRDAGDAGWIEHGRAANVHPPELRTHDRTGARIDEVRYHPSYHALMGHAVANGMAAAPWHPAAPAGAHVARAARFIVWSRVDAGHTCPMSMTYAAVPALRAEPDLAALWEPRLVAGTYDPRPIAPGDKAGVTVGMAMTEKQGGSDVRANTTTAESAGDGTWRLSGHKWFCSAPMSDAFLVLAQAPGGLSCFLVARRAEDGTANPFHIQRLKDKLGDRSNASSEVEWDGSTVAHLIGEEGRGVATIIEMVAHTRLDCAAGAAGSMRHGLAEAAWHVAHRHAFGRRLAEAPLMRAVLADLTVESEAATALALRLARCFDRSDDPAEVAFRRLATPIAKYWLCKRAPGHAAEALECLGGNGFVEESPLPRLFRQSPLNGIWEGSGNVQCLDVLRALTRSPESLEVLMAEVQGASGADARLDAAAAAAVADIPGAGEADARRIVERLALVLCGALLVAHGDAAVTEAFCATRFDPAGGLAYGAWPGGLPVDAICERVLDPLGG